METQQIRKNEPLCDVFAAQGILVVLLAIGIVTLHIFAPESCNALLHEWHRIYAESPEITAWAAEVCEWFASIFAV